MTRKSFATQTLLWSLEMMIQKISQAQKWNTAKGRHQHQPFESEILPFSSEHKRIQEQEQIVNNNIKKQREKWRREREKDREWEKKKRHFIFWLSAEKVPMKKNNGRNNHETLLNRSNMLEHPLLYALPNFMVTYF